MPKLRIFRLAPPGRGGDRHTGGERGQALVEAALVVVALAVLSLLVVEFGRAFMVSNTVTNAARVGARLASIAPLAERDPNGILSASYVTTVEGEVRNEVASLDPSFATAMTVQVNQIDGPPEMVEVRVIGTLPAIFNYRSTAEFDIDRSVTFPDQGRRTSAGGPPPGP